MGGGIKRGSEVPKARESCSFLRPHKNQAKRLECWQFIDSGVSQVRNCRQNHGCDYEKMQQFYGFGTFSALGALWGLSGASRAAAWNPLGHLGLSWGLLGALRGCLGGLEGRFFSKIWPLDL